MLTGGLKLDTGGDSSWNHTLTSSQCSPVRAVLINNKKNSDTRSTNFLTSRAYADYFNGLGFRLHLAQKNLLCRRTMMASPAPPTASSVLTFSSTAAEDETRNGDKSFAKIACPLCGASTVAREDSVVCLSCLAGSADWKRPLEEHIKRYPKVLSFARCPDCLRVCASEEHKHTSRWIEADHESEELMGLLLRKIRSALLGKRAVSAIQGMSRALGDGELSLEDARFVWTEPHSRRVVLEVVVGHAAAKLGQRSTTRHKCSITFVEERKTCHTCAEPRRGKMGSSGSGSFAAKIQIRAHGTLGGGRRTLRGLEDAVIKNKAATAARRASNGGLDVEFQSRADAAKFLADLRRLGKAPLKFSENSKKLVTHDEHSNSSEWKMTTLISIPPIDKHDLCFSHDSFSLVLAVRTSMRLVDISTTKERDVGAEAYFKKPFEAVASTKDMVRFLVDESGLVASRTERNDLDQPRSFYAPFQTKPGKAYLGYDLTTISHRVDVSKDVPTIVLVVPAPVNEDEDGRLDGTAPSPELTSLSRKERRKLKQRQAQAATKEEASSFSPPPTTPPPEEEEWWSDETPHE